MKDVRLPMLRKMVRLAGLTVIEALVVLVLIAVLALVIIPRIVELGAR